MHAGVQFEVNRRGFLLIEFSRVNKFFGTFHVLKEIDLTISQGKSLSSLDLPAPARARSCAASIGLKALRMASSS